MPKYFTFQQAVNLLPKLEPEIRQAILLRRESERAEQELQHTNARVMMMGGMVIDRERLLALQARRDATSMRLKETLESIQREGCQVKDLDMGLIDFPTLFNGKEVCLCWKLGESTIAFWHGAEEGYAGRKRIDQEFLNKHEGDRPS